MFSFIAAQMLLVKQVSLHGTAPALLPVQFLKYFILCAS